MGSDVVRGAPKVWGPEGWEAQNFAFFFPSPVPIFAFFLSLSGCLLMDFGGF